MAINDNHTYNPTLWVNNSEPDIDAEHLNKIESALQEHGITLNDLAAAVGQRIMKSQIVNNLLSTDANTVLSGAMGKNLADKDANLQSQITQLNGEMFSVRVEAVPITSGYITVTDSRLKYETKCACSQAYIPADGAIAYSIVVQVQFKNANFYIRKIDGTKPEDGTLISIDAVFFNN